MVYFWATFVQNFPNIHPSITAIVHIAILLFMGCFSTNPALVISAFEALVFGLLLSQSSFIHKNYVRIFRRRCNLRVRLRRTTEKTSMVHERIGMEERKDFYSSSGNFQLTRKTKRSTEYQQLLSYTLFP